MSIADGEPPTEYQTPGQLTLPIAAGSSTTGLWCDTCSLPSRCDIPIYALGADGPSLIGIQSICTNASTGGHH
jgi:hypothetical protein